MKKLIIILLMAAFCALPVHGPLAVTQPGDAILGVWEVAEKDAHIEIYRQGDRYHGKIVWLRAGEEPGDNEDRMFETPKVGLVIVRDFRYEGKEWKGGTLYDPEDGKSYRGVITLDNQGALRVRGFIGVSLLGRTTVWHRVK